MKTLSTSLMELDFAHPFTHLVRFFSSIIMTQRVSFI